MRLKEEELEAMADRLIEEAAGVESAFRKEADSSASQKTTEQTVLQKLNRQICGPESSDEEAAVNNLMLQKELERILENDLEPREKRILELRYGIIDGKVRSLAEVGKELNLTGERIRQIEAKALRKLRHSNVSKVDK